MTATATDSLSDSASTTAVLIATLVGKFTGLQIDGWVGALVALFILYAGVSAAKETISPLLGQAPDEELVSSIQRITMGFPPILGIHDLVVHDYGPGRLMISLHAEVPAEGNIMELHDAIDNAEAALREQLRCEAVIHMDPVASNDAVTIETKKKVTELVHSIDTAISIHYFRMVAGPTHTNVIFDAVVPFGYPKSNQQLTEEIRALVREMDGNYFAVVTVENSYVRQ